VRLRLHTYWRSGASWRVRIGLGLKELDWEPVFVHLLQGDTREPAFRARNPMGQVPVLEVEEDDGAGVVLTQSLAILEYLDERWPDRGAPLLPRGSASARARARMLAEIVNAGIQPLQNLSVTQRLGALGVDTAAWVKDVVGGGLSALEALAGDDAFLAGPAPSVADACLVPQLYSARRFGVDVSAYPRLCAVEARCAAIPAFARARPEVQGDAPPSGAT
jgi:maleylpyruvate isomerase